MINRKMVWLSTLVFTIILAGCNQPADDVEITGNKGHDAYGHDINKISVFALESDEDPLKIDDDKAAPATVDFNPVTVINGQAVDSDVKVEHFLQELATAQSSVGEIWDDNYNNLYSTYTNHSYIIKDETLTLTESQAEEVASQLEELHNQYAELESDIKDLEVPKVVAENNMDTVETTIDEISRAIENRTLALIEFKSIFEEDDHGKHEELLAIHIENSEKYLNQADENINDLIAAVNDK